MKITDIKITRHKITLDPVFNASWDTKPRTEFEATLVRVETDEGLTGFGSGDDMRGFEGYKNLFIGKDPRQIETLFRILLNIDFHSCRPWPLDFALWDLYGKIVGEPVWRLLGGRSNRVAAYASSGTLRNPIELSEAAARFQEEGFKALKIRFHRGDWRDDIEALAAVRDVVGDEMELMADCNQGWRMPWDTAVPWKLKDALTVARELEELGVYWMEEPLYRTDIDNMRRLRDMVDIRIAGGEMTRDLDVFRDIMVVGALDVIQPDAALVGGITGLRRLSVMAEAFGITFTPHTWTNGIGVIANAHLTAGIGCAPFLEFPYDPPEWSLAARDFMLQDPLTVDENGMIILSERPGLGFELDHDRLQSTQLD